METPVAGPTLRRWVSFNIVGALGVFVQLATLAVLVRMAHVHYLAASLVAVEAALLHNFLWHQRWTWRDRPVTGPMGWLRRLVRFHMINGCVSFVGSAAIMTVLVGVAELDPIFSNVAAILMCSIVNFFGGDRLVFSARASMPRTARLRTGIALLLIAGVAGADSPPTASAEIAELNQATLAAWQAYERQVDERYRRVRERGTFFAHDEFGAAATWRDTAMAGGVPMLRIETPKPASADVPVPDGRVHHWAGAVFVRGLNVDAVLRHLQDRAGRESESYEDVLASKLLSRDGDSLRVYMKLRRTSVITVTYNTEHAVEYRRLGGLRASSRSVATKIAELAEAGTPREHEKPVGSDRGFLWRLDAYWRYEQQGDGVLIECESVSLSRAVPTLLRPFINRTVEGIARESLERTLTSLRVSLSTPK